MRPLEIFFRRPSTGSSVYEEVEVPLNLTDEAIRHTITSYLRNNFPSWELTVWRDLLPVQGKMK